jgi:hypothetical protein
MPTCPRGHQSADEEYCEECGLAMNGAVASAPSVSAQPDPPMAPPAHAATCPACGAALEGRFCEECGHDSLVAPPAGALRPPAPAEPPPVPTPAPPPISVPPPVAPPVWSVTVNADRKYYESVVAIGGPDAASIIFPAYCPERFFSLNRKETTIGRRSASRGIEPTIDLTGPPEDPGVSHLHAVLLLGPDNSLSIVDVDSSNGTTLNDSESSLRPNVSHPLSDGDRIHLGAWTTITVRRG